MAHLKNYKSPKGLMVLLVSHDAKLHIPFRQSDSRLLPNVDAKDFAPGDFVRMPRSVGKIAPAKVQPFPHKTQAEIVWGQAPVCSLAAEVTRGMFQTLFTQCSR